MSTASSSSKTTSMRAVKVAINHRTCHTDQDLHRPNMIHMGTNKIDIRTNRIHMDTDDLIAITVDMIANTVDMITSKINGTNQINTVDTATEERQILPILRSRTEKYS